MRATAAAPLERLLQGTGARIRGNPSVPIESLVTDSRAARPGAAFFCLRGARADGHVFAQDAIARGAVAVVADQPIDVTAATALAVVDDVLAALSPAAATLYDHPSRSLTCVGVTGTNGKTTTVTLVDSIARAAGRRFGRIGTLGAFVNGAPFEELRNTTPFAHDLQQLLARMRDETAQGVALEVSSHALKLHRVDDVEFDVVAHTNLTQDHLDFHPTFEDYRDAKRSLILGPWPRSTKAAPTAILNADDDEGRALARLRPGALTFGIENPSALFNATDVRLESDRSSFAVKALRPSPFTVRLPGPFNVSNALAALAIGSALDLDVEAMAEGLEAVDRVPGRMIALTGGDITVYVDYAHTPDGMEKVLRAARAVTKGKLHCVFGCGGDRDRSKRPIMGRIAQQLSDHVIVTNDNPRHEDPAAILAEIVAGMSDRAGYEVIADRTRAIESAIAESRPGDVVVLAGKGHERYQLVREERIPFSDEEVARAALARRAACR